MGIVMRDYYPFGLTFNSYTSGTENLYKYAGNEEQKEWSVYDFNARMYDPALGRFNSIDPMAEKRSWLNPYNYVQNNPLRRIDPTGFLDHIFDQQEDGSYVKREGVENDGGEKNHMFVNNDGTTDYINQETGFRVTLNADGEVIDSYQPEGKEFDMSESYAAFSETPRGEAFEQTLSNVAAVAGLVVAGPSVVAAGEVTVVRVAAAAGVINGVDDLSTNFTENRNSLIQNQLGEQNGSFLKMGMNILGAIVGGANSGFKFANKEAMDGVVNGVGVTLDGKGVVDKTKDIFDK